MNTEQSLIQANAGAFYVFDTETLRGCVEKLRVLLEEGLE